MESEQERMGASGFLKEEEMKNRTVCTPFFLHCSSRVLRGKYVDFSAVTMWLVYLELIES